jgi:DNA-binding response OmpR family regulator
MSILYIEDDPRLGDMVQTYLGNSGLEVTIAKNGASGLSMLKKQDFDLLLLDLTLPDMDGLDLCRSLRETSDLPILMLTARGEPMDRIIGLELGADDYLPKPFEPRELLARVRALMRRREPASRSTILHFGQLDIDLDAHQARLKGKPCQLTSHQFNILVTLAQKAGRVLSRETLMDLVKNDKLDPFDRSIDVHISRIRSAIEDDPKHPTRLITVRGSGYVFAKTQD